MMFRPLPVLTIAVVPALALLVWLGSWQIGRAHEKAEAVASFERMRDGPPTEVPQAFCELPATPYEEGGSLSRLIEGQMLYTLLSPVDERATPLRMFAQSPTGGPGWAHYTLLIPPGCTLTAWPLLVEQGFEPANTADAGVSDADIAERYVLTAWPAKPAMLAPNDPKTNDWHWYDAPEIAKHFGVPEINAKYFLRKFRNELPPSLVKVPPAQHYGYAATWYGMAISLVVIYFAFHARAGRLRFRPTDADKA